jgi:hypothetical protein
LCRRTFLQPVSLYRENRELLESIDVEKAESIGEFLRTAEALFEVAEVRIPGFFILNLKRALKEFTIDEIMLFHRNAFVEKPKIERVWRFRI